MSERDRPGERSILLVHLGRLLAPLFDLAERLLPPTPAEYRVAAAMFHADLDRWQPEMDRFVTVGDFRFGHERDDIIHPLHALFHHLGQLARDAATEPPEKQLRLRNVLRACQDDVINAIDRVPIEWTAHLLGAQTPFSTCLKIADVIGTTRMRLHYFDRYLTPDFYSLYLRSLNRNVEVRVVTTKGTAQYGVTSVLSISRLAAQEFSNYKLIECNPVELHDRNLRIDDQVFFLGASVKDAGTHPTNFAPGDSTAQGHYVLDDILMKGTAIS